MTKIYIILTLLLLLAILIFIFRAKLNTFLSKPETIANIKEMCVWADENIRGTKQGQERLAYVCGKLCQLVPKPLQPFVTAEKLAAVVNAVFDEIKKTLNDGTTVAVVNDLFKKYAVTENGHSIVK